MACIVKIGLFAWLISALAFEAAAEVKVERVFREQPPCPAGLGLICQQPIESACWLYAGTPAGRDPYVSRFRKSFIKTGSAPLEIDISGDERFWLLLDGKTIARGPTRGCEMRWFYQSYRIELDPGEHLLEVLVIALGDVGPLAQMSHRPAFILKAYGDYDELLTTGKAQWEFGELPRATLKARGPGGGSWGGGHRFEMRGTSFVNAQPTKWHAAYNAADAIKSPAAFGIRKRFGWKLFPSLLPDQMSRRVRPGSSGDGDFDALIREGRPLTVPARSTRTFVWDLGDYYCLYPRMKTAGGKGAAIEWGWTEALVNSKNQKTNRSQREGMRVPEVFADFFLPDGRPDGDFTTPWFRCGRWSVVKITTADEPLTIRDIVTEETRYPAAVTASFRCDDDSLGRIGAICNRAMEMCSHEMFFDCPFIEQQMYAGDSRVEWLASAAMYADPRLVRHSIGLFDAARYGNGFVPMNFPSRRVQESGTYTICWLMSIGDYAFWRDDSEGLKAMIPGMMHTYESIRCYEDADGILTTLPGWNFVDWGFYAPQSAAVCNAAVSLTWHKAILNCAKAMEALGESERAAGIRRHAERVGRGIVKRFFDPKSGLLADWSGEKPRFSEHTQSLAIMSGILSPELREKAVAALAGSGPSLQKASVYFMHYLFAAYFRIDRPDLFLKRLDLWRMFVENGFATTPEESNLGSRSDCHAWSAHPVFHYQTGLAGISPAAPFFRKVKIAPRPGPLSFIDSSYPHPRGDIELDLKFHDGGVTGTVVLPAGISGEFEWKGKSLRLHPGKNVIKTPIQAARSSISPCHAHV